MNIWRIHLKPASKSGFNSREYCIVNKLVGFGWPISDVTAPITFSEYEERGKDTYTKNNDKSWYPNWNAFYYRMQIGDLIWTRTSDGVYYLGSISSEWRYDHSDDAINMDIANVRDCNWVKVGTVDAVPGKVLTSFIASRTLQRIHDTTIHYYSQLMFNELSGSELYSPEPLPEQDIFALLSPNDCEDAVGIYLQIKKNYLMVPSSCKADTSGYEYELIHRESKERAVVQVKKGEADLNQDDYKSIEETVYLFTTNGRYLGVERKNMICLKPSEIKEFLYEYQEYLPTKIRFWVEKTNEN